MSMITLVKMSERTSRKPCKVCGSTAIYWAKDEATGKFILIDANSTTRAVSKGGTVPITSVHKCNLSAAASAPESDEFDSDERPMPPSTSMLGWPYPNAAVIAEIKADRKIMAIKEYRNQTGYGLKESKDYVDAFASGRIPIRSEGTPVVQPAAVMPSLPTDPHPGSQEAAAAAALQTLMGALTPKVDTETVRAMVKEELQQIVFPTRTVVIREGQEAKPIEGTTHCQLADVVSDVAAGEHVMMVGPAGTGKSTIAKHAAEALGMEFSELSITPDMSRARIEGYMNATGDYVRTVARDRFEYGGVMHFDEIDNGHPSIMALINGMASNGHFGFPDGVVKRHDDFRLIASANTYGRGPDRKYVGRMQLDAATLDRFAVETIEYDEALERTVCLSTGLEASRVNEVLAYTRYIRRKADQHSMVVVISPRASMGMCRLLKQGRTWKAASDARVRKGLSDQDWRKISEGAPTAA